MLFRVYFIILLFFQTGAAFSQDKSSVFYEVIKDDSVKMFFNEHYRFIERKCSDFVRYVRVDNEGNFNGYYEDLSNDSLLLGRGHYIHGKKSGYFEIYHPNGKINCKGGYLDNTPVGQWEYFYETGLPERTIRITESDTVLVRFVDTKGNVNVIDGNGEFYGNVGRNTSGLTAKGRVENGVPDGKWTSVMFKNTVFCNEEFEHGRFIRGTFPNAMAGAKKKYSNKSFIDVFFLDNYLSSLEAFSLEKCTDSTRASSRRSYSFDMEGFNSELRRKINRVIDTDLKNGNADDYQIGDNYLTIQFSADKEGKAKDLKLVSGWGQQFFNAISTAINMRTTFPSDTKTIFFNLKLQVFQNFSYRYNFQFSANGKFR